MEKPISPRADNRDVARFERWAATYEKSFLQAWFIDTLHSKMLDLLSKAGPVNEPPRILDVGCGTGRLLRAVSARFPATQLLGVDPAFGMLAEAQRLAPHAFFQLAAAEALPLGDQTVEVALSSLSFHHWADQQKGLQEVARVLRPGGWFCLADQTIWFTRFFGERPRSRKAVVALLRNAGLAVRQQQTLGLRAVLISLAQK
jgi:ubiquinone/menaquinone biosynthesis C-methylase UbiE